MDSVPGIWGPEMDLARGSSIDPLDPATGVDASLPIAYLGSPERANHSNGDHSTGDVTLDFHPMPCLGH